MLCSGGGTSRRRDHSVSVILMAWSDQDPTGDRRALACRFQAADRRPTWNWTSCRIVSIGNGRNAVEYQEL
jgi:hypothetical protein